MRTRTLLLLIIVLVLLWRFKPTKAWGELKRMWAQRELLLGTLVVIIAIYMAYGFYQLYQRGGLDP